jgi:hypothetical protein
VASWAEAGAERSPSRPDGRDARRCPYCAEAIDLRRCDVVSAVRRPAHAAGQTDFDNLEADPVEAPSGGRHGDVGDGRRYGYDLLYDARARADGRASVSFMQELLGSARAAGGVTPLTRLAPPQKLPRRVCELCHRLLPVELDELDTRILAVVGVTGAGKTHYLARALTDGSRRGTLLRFGCSEFAPTDADQTAHTLHNDYYAPVVRRGELFSPTNPEEAPRQFTFTVAVEDEQFLLVTHDIAGESLTDPEQRAQQLTFLRHAAALIFLLDPVEFDAVRSVLPAELLGKDKPADQVHLLRQCLRELDSANTYEVPVRLVVTKCDLLATYCGVRGLWEHQPASRWSDDLGRISDDVQRALGMLGETEVLRLLSRRQRVLFHAVSALGAPPGPDGRLVEAEPIRCSDPLGAGLLGMVRQPVMHRD